MLVYDGALSARGEGLPRLRSQARRTEPAVMWQLTDEMLRQQLTDHPGVGKMLPGLRDQVGRGELTPVTAATHIIAQLRGD